MLEEHGQPLLDLSMYISGQNYVSVTRPLLSSILPWPLQYVVPLKLKTLARSRTEHLGLSSLDIDADEDDRAASSAGNASSQLGSTFLARSKVTATSLLNQPEHTTKIRLSALCASVFEPLQDRLGGKRFLLSSTGPSSVDCIALGLLSLALVPGMPHPWLADELLNNYGALSEYVMGGRSSILDKTSLRHEKMSPASNGNGPWWNSALAIAAISVRMLLEATNGAIPFGSPVRDSTLFRESDMKDGQLGAGDSSRASLPQR
ncbi:MAG: hypothetical protein M1825_002765 [Sarcosagium campestre]|nr:MAG: hypothetical protein M1825_002765 [Sarcosagium campestre]